ncbi:uncharacterized protein LOC117385045 isoform X1 [Periophthalmus magnuspinnatus]|uniref:uncharacterized protein LOC117385045 isoform X1 n=1 Tax=Periophthalmus magnuspinnatus TaxID=409849 RepID=UPI0024369F75|nr:uncharacterized protein LOC117385045 isoform X1 [Periophthalmus magnuspinnatus]
MTFFFYAFVLSLYHITLCFTAPIETVIVQVQVGAEPVMQQVFLNGVAFTGQNLEINNILQSMADAVLPLRGVSQTAELRNHTVLRSRDCILEGSQLHWTDRVFLDGKVHLSLESSDTWTAHVPQARVLKEKWDQEVERTKMERVRLQEGCIQLMKELKFTEEQKVSHIPLPQLLIPLLAVLAFTGLIVISLRLSKIVGPRQPGGVIGSVIHYPKDMPEETHDIKGFGYHTI